MKLDTGDLSKRSSDLLDFCPYRPNITSNSYEDRKKIRGKGKGKFVPVLN
jgi:hypothetical protein